MRHPTNFNAKKRSIKELEKSANNIRISIINMLEAAGSGHTAGPLGLADIFASLYFDILKHDPDFPDWDERDILLLSNGHTVPVRYAAMAEAGYFSKKELTTLRELGSRLQGHPERTKLPGLEHTSGPLGCGLSQACGIALSMKLRSQKHRWVYVVMGDGELNEGNVWEAAMLANRYELDNIIAIVDRNYIQIDGATEDVMPLEDLAAKWKAFGWHVIEISGNDIEAVIDACAMGRSILDKPVVIVAHDVAGKGVEFMEYDFHWHGMMHNHQEAMDALKQLRSLGGKIRESMSDSSKLNQYFLEMGDENNRKNIRDGFGNGLKEAADRDPNVVALCADLTVSTKMDILREAYPERFFEVGIAEQNLVTVSSGMASQGLVPFCSSYAASCPGRCWEQIRTTICLNDLPVKVIGSHAGVSVGPDGATHQMLEDIAIMRSLPNMVVVAPGDMEEARKATLAMAADHRPNYMRLSREATSTFTTSKTPFEIGKAYVYRPGTDVSIISTGSLTYQALKAAESLSRSGIEAEVVHCPTIKPLDAATIIASVSKTRCVVSLEEHQVNGGLGGAIAELLVEHYPAPMRRIGVKDRYGESGTPDELLEYFGLTHKDVVLTVHSMLQDIGKI